MADTNNNIKKFLDQAGVSTLWSRIAAEVSAVDKKLLKMLKILLLTLVKSRLWKVKLLL